MRPARLLALALPLLLPLSLDAPARADTQPTHTELYQGAVPDDVVAASSAPGHSWKPGAAKYGVGATIDEPVTMADGAVLRVNTYFPTDLATGKPAKGPFPVLLTQTPYGKGTSATPAAGGGATGGANTYLLSRGYIEVVADVRGTGDSGGDWGLFDPVQTTDGVALVKFAAARANSTHEVGLYGPSYLGINQLLTAGSVGKNSPLKAIFPLVASNDIFRDTSFMGGLIDTEFGLSYLGGITAALNLANPVGDAAAGGNPDAAAVTAAHAENVAKYNVGFSAKILADGDEAYDQDYWRTREPRTVLADIVANDVPAYLVGGEYDIFQRGEPLNYAGLQNAYAGRSVEAPMLAGQKTTGRYQLLDGPFTHLVGSAPKIDVLQLEWFDTWLKHADTGMADTPTPLHYFDIGTDRYAETTTYPFTGVTPTRYYLGATAGDDALSTNEGALSTTPPKAAGADTLVWSPTGSPCGRSIDQWGLGAYSTATDSATVTSAPCTTDDRTTAAGPSALTYTTPAFPAARTLAGPIAATLYATNRTTTDSEWVVSVEDVAPDGTSKPLTEGALLGSHRAVDDSRSWKAADGQYLLPYHHYTRAKATQVPAGQQARYDVEVFPTYSTIAKGHRVRMTLSSADAPHLSADSAQLPNLVGGVYAVGRGPGALSSIELPLSAAARATTPTTGTTRPTASGPASGGSSDPAPSGAALATTGSDPALPATAAVLTVGAAVLLRRRRRRA